MAIFRRSRRSGNDGKRGHPAIGVLGRNRRRQAMDLHRLDPSGRWMPTANGAKVTLLRIDTASGAPPSTGQSADSRTSLSIAFMH
jgi:hypothetical protein